MQIHLGVIVVPEPESKLDTFELANILESEYNIFGGYAEDRLQFIADKMTESLANSLDDLLMGATVQNPFADAEQEIEQNFKDLMSQEMLPNITGTYPTQSALEGRSRRFKNRKNPKGRRPSFIDTGTLQNNLKVWTEYGNT
jgi:hypothetical protein